MFHRKGIAEAKEISPSRKSLIQELKSINETSTHCTDNSTAIFDLDNVVIESTQELGSDQWFVKLLNYACEIIVDQDEAITTVLTIYHAVQHHAEMQAVEREVSQLIKELQEKPLPVIGLTARGTPIMDRTLAQLKKLDIDFSKHHAEKYLEFSINEISPKVAYKDGIIFCNGNDKGICLAKFFQIIEYTPEHLVMIDDKEKHLVSVNARVTCDFVGLRYSYLDQKAKTIDMHKAETQLTELEPQLDAQVRVAIAKISPLLRNSVLASLTSIPAENKPMASHIKTIHR